MDICRQFGIGSGGPIVPKRITIYQSFTLAGFPQDKSEICNAWGRVGFAHARVAWTIPSVLSLMFSQYLKVLSCCNDAETIRANYELRTLAAAMDQIRHINAQLLWWPNWNQTTGPHDQ